MIIAFYCVLFRHSDNSFLKMSLYLFNVYDFLLMSSQLKTKLKNSVLNKKLYFSLSVCYYQVTYAFQSASTLYSFLNVKELLVRNRRDIWSLRNSSRIQTHNHLVCKRTPNHLAKLAKWSSCVVSTYLYGAFDCIFLSCHVRVSEWIYTL